MGVHGLSTYLRETRKLSESYALPSSGGDGINIVVDGWSFIYDVYRSSGLPWVYGGQYAAFGKIVTAVVDAWVSVGFTIYFVFDGPCPSLKFPTQVSQSSLLLAYTACLDALKAICRSTDAVSIHYADEEGDPYAVELAGRVGAFVVGTDSDFVIFNSEGYRGYIPLDEMVWTVPTPEEPTIVGDDDDFQQVRKPKARKKAMNPGSSRGIIPPESTSELSLSFTAYSPMALASHLNLPVTLLPLFGALVGNDFSNQSASPRRNVQILFFERHLNLSQRITRVATTMHSILSVSTQKGKQKPVGSVMDLIDKTVNALLVRSISSMGSGEIEAIVERIVEATLQYALPKNEDDTQDLWPTDICALHEADICPILPMFSRLVTAEALVEERENDDELLKRNELRSQYLSAYRDGHLDPKVLDILHTGTSWPRLFLETPDFETVSRVFGRPLRQWGYAILHDALGLQPPSDEEITSEVDDSDDEKGADLLAPLKGALDQLVSDDDKAATPASSSTRGTQSPIIIEYVRRGTRIAEEPVTVPSISDLLSSISSADLPFNTLPILSQPEPDRFTILLRVLKSDTIPIRSLAPEKLAAVLCLRWVLLTLHSRALENGSKEREKERWTRKEARCFLAAFSWTAEEKPPSGQENTFPEILDRNVQLTAQVLTALESIAHFSQILLVNNRLPSPALLFSGADFHSYLTGIKTAHVPDTLWDACVDDIGEAFGDERKKKPKKTKQAPALLPKKPAGGGLFDLLMDADA
ncbi:XPG-I-2 domain-containing protein [Mycena sanguinolenta]|uniref:XPG-I-2 domain-containing protein n=1 Tax=Mycena sanguinolenta TaxID=230812 RepID=A0A8H6ZE57_9AGAR|nr:XPG-I-2 domain-containing protein [Mycena sanguinolenta]